MRRVLIYAYTAFILIMLMNFLYYRSMYQKQKSYVTDLLDRQVQIVGTEVDSINNNFISDLTRIGYDLEMSAFFNKSDPDGRRRIIDMVKNFMDEYKDFITRIRIYDNNLHEFTLSKDELKNDWIEGEFFALEQREILPVERLVISGNDYSYYGTILSNGKVIGNIIVNVDYRKYFRKLFSKFSMRDYQWQWVTDETGQIIFENSGKKISYSQLDKINANLDEGIFSNIEHEATIDGESQFILSSYYSTQLLLRNLGIIFSAPSTPFQKYIIINSIFIVTATLLIIQIVIFIFWRFVKKESKEKERLAASEEILFQLIDNMPVGVIIYNSRKEILKANKTAAGLYSFDNEKNMKGEVMPELALSYENEYFSKHLGSRFNPERFAVIRKNGTEIILIRFTSPVNFMGESATLEILTDITLIESARRQEANANEAKSDFLARMSYEIRTPLSGIIGMTDLLKNSDLPTESREMVNLLRRSTEVLMGVINDILDFSKIESGSMILNENPFNLREEAANAISMANVLASGKDITIRSNISNDLPLSVIGDSLRIRHILLNLLSHSIFSTESGEIVLNCITKEKNNGIYTIQFEIADTGRSFDRESLKKLFGDFYSSEPLDIRRNELSAFGTVLSRHLIELMGGELHAVSPSGLSGDRGIRIIFTIRLSSGEKEVKNIRLSDIHETFQIRALVITGSDNRDDEFIGLVRKTGITTSITSFNKSTAGQIRANLEGTSEKYNLIIILNEPDFDGFEAAKILNEAHLTEKFIVIMVSSADIKGNYMKSISLGIDHYMVKPVDSVMFIDKLKESYISLESESSPVSLENVKKELRILVVEDNRMNQLILIKMLKSLGYECDMAEDGYEGFTRAKSGGYDLIFMDLLLPEMDGFEASRRISENDKNVIIVAFTADIMLDTKRKAEMSGIKDFVSKPVNIDDLKKLFVKYFSIG